MAPRGDRLSGALLLVLVAWGGDVLSVDQQLRQVITFNDHAYLNDFTPPSRPSRRPPPASALLYRFGWEGPVLARGQSL